jgi:hypothetical protein
VRISTYAMPPLAPNATVRPELVEGLANTGNGTNNALTTTPGLVGLATFQIAVLPQSDGPTQFTGKVLDHTGKPLQGVRVTISRTPLSVTTDAAGNFTFLQDVPQGKLDLFVDGRAVTGTVPLPGNNQTTPTQYPSLHFEVLAIRGQKNLLPHPIYLPPLLMSQAKIVGGNEDVSLTIPGRDGFEMIVKANSVTFPDGTRIGPLVVSPVADDRLPMSPPGGGSSFMPGAAATIQPSGTRFDPPIEVRLPNTSGYAPGERVVIYHWDHDIGQYVAMGQATVTDDGAQLITDPGSGITKAGWHGPPTPPPPPPPNCGVQGAPRGTFAKIKVFGNDTDPIYVGLNDPLSFVAEDDMQGNCSKKYEWSFGDGEISPAKNPFHSYAVEGQKTVTLKAWCEPRASCRSAAAVTLDDSKTITVCKELPARYSYIPIVTSVVEGGANTLAVLASRPRALGAVAPEKFVLDIDVTCQQGNWVPFVKSGNLEIGKMILQPAAPYARWYSAAVNSLDYCSQAELLANRAVSDARYSGPNWFTDIGIDTHEEHHVAGHRARAGSWLDVIDKKIRSEHSASVSATTAEAVLARARAAYSDAVKLADEFARYSSAEGGYAEDGLLSGYGGSGSAYRAEGAANRPYILEICSKAKAERWGREGTGACRVCP